MFWPVIAATTLAFFAMVGFEDSVNMAEECKDPTGIFPKCCSPACSSPARSTCWSRSRRLRWFRRSSSAKARRRCCKVVQAGAPSFPVWIFGFITMFAVANSALINMLMASRLVYGMSREHVLPPVLGKVHATPPHALYRDRLHDAAGVRADHLRRRGAGARRHDRAAAALRLHRGQYRGAGAAQGHASTHEHFRTPTILPVLGAISCAFLAGPWTGRAIRCSTRLPAS